MVIGLDRRHAEQSRTTAAASRSRRPRTIPGVARRPRSPCRSRCGSTARPAIETRIEARQRQGQYARSTVVQWLRFGGAEQRLRIIGSAPRGGLDRPRFRASAPCATGFRTVDSNSTGALSAGVKCNHATDQAALLDSPPLTAAGAALAPPFETRRPAPAAAPARRS